MYVARTPIVTSDLNQGDLIGPVLRPKVVVAKNFVKAHDKSRNFEWPVSPADLNKSPTALRLMAGVERLEVALVLSSSCDNAGGRNAILLAPTRPFALTSPEDDPVERWREIQEAATGSGSPKLFYLTPSDDYGIDRREAVLPDLFPVSHDYLEGQIADLGTRRLCGLSEEATVHLQWAMGLFFGRNARDDFGWPGRADLREKLRSIERQLGEAKEEKATKLREEATRIRRHLSVPSTETDAPIVVEAGPLSVPALSEASLASTAPAAGAIGTPAPPPGTDGDVPSGHTPDDVSRG